ncbi:head decoration protein [Erwinia endophytica]|uniref:head decoration protein n=1 Tax=Erwinia endophytica TaxID=1563158 RepID=UPI0012660616|nr:head decoration protein [Erwinia endophytica]KAB8307254.1 head decoration protein [Erwinia endophytica]
MINEETFEYHQPLGGSDQAHTAVAPSGISSATPALTPLMLSGSTLVAWDGQAAGTAVGVLALALEGGETLLTYYKTGTFRIEDLVWPADVAEDVQRNAFAGTSCSVV